MCVRSAGTEEGRKLKESLGLGARLSWGSLSSLTGTTGCLICAHHVGFAGIVSGVEKRSDSTGLEKTDEAKLPHFDQF